MNKVSTAKPERYKLGDKVIARWVDGKLYPGQIHQVLGSDNFLVLFEDGLQRAMKGNHIEPNLNPVPRTELPFEDARQQRAIHESDICDLIINCDCGSIEDTGFLVQCEHCLTFQHAVCLDVKTDADLLEAITCSSCLKPKGVRESCRYKFDHSWLKDSTLPSLVAGKNDTPVADQRIASVNFLLEAALECLEALHGLRAKIPLKDEKVTSCKELKCWSKSWVTTDFESLPVIQSKPPPSVTTPSKSKSKSKKSRSTRKAKQISKALDIDATDPCSSLHTEDSNLSSTTVANQLIAEKSVESTHQPNPMETNKNPDESSAVNLDEVCQKHLEEHIEDIRSRLEIRLEYIESRIDELEEWFGPDLGPLDNEGNREDFKFALKNLQTSLRIFKEIQVINKQLTDSDEQSSDSLSDLEVDDESDEDYQPSAKTDRSKNQ